MKFWKKSNFWTILRFLSNLLEYYFRLVSICSYETPCVCSYGIGKPWKKMSQKYTKYIGVKSEKVQFLDDFPTFVKLTRSSIFAKFMLIVSIIMKGCIYDFTVVTVEFLVITNMDLVSYLLYMWPRRIIIFISVFRKNLPFSDFHDFF